MLTDFEQFAVMQGWPIFKAGPDTTDTYLAHETEYAYLGWEARSYEAREDGTCFVDGLGWVVQTSKAAAYVGDFLRQTADAIAKLDGKPVTHITATCEHCGCAVFSWSQNHAANCPGMPL